LGSFVWILKREGSGLNLREEGGFGKDFMGRDPEIEPIPSLGGGRGRKKVKLRENGPERLTADEVEGGLDKLCLLFPWRSECVSKLEKEKDPFRWYTYLRDRGRLFWPGKSQPFEQIRGGKLSTKPPGQPHPIHLLRKEAKESWQEKLKRQSKTLPQAIDEYEKRYGRRPPRGFDEWFYHALANDFILRDEFDIVDQFVTPFLAVKPDEMRRRQEMLMNDEEFWLQVRKFNLFLLSLPFPSYSSPIPSPQTPPFTI